MSDLEPVIIEAAQADLPEVRRLFREYEQSIGIDLCFQGFEHELASLPGVYARPRGFIFLARNGHSPVACIALKPLSSSVCEMKRLFVQPAAQGAGLGRRLAEACIAEAKAIGYQTMKLDTLAQMKAAISLYQSLGFTDCEAYYDNPLEGARYMELPLA